MSALIATRVVAGPAGAGLVSPAALAGAVSGFPPERRGSALGIWGASAGVSNLLGPLLGGLLTVTLGWRANWWALVPLALIAAAGIARRVPRGSSTARKPGSQGYYQVNPRRARRHARRGTHVRGDDRLLLPGVAISPARGRLLGARRLQRPCDRRPAGGGGRSRSAAACWSTSTGSGFPRSSASRSPPAGLAVLAHPGHAAFQPGHDPAADPGRLRARDAVRPDLARGAERNSAGLARADLGGPASVGRLFVGAGLGRGTGRRRPIWRHRCVHGARRDCCCAAAFSASPWEFPRRRAWGRPAAASHGRRRSRSSRFAQLFLRRRYWGKRSWSWSSRKTERPEPAAE